MEPNFSGYVTKANLKCADGRVIAPGAFKHQDGMKVPVVYQHNHTDANQILGHAILTEKEDGVWGDIFLNDSPTAKNALIAVQHGDIDKFSIWAKNLIERGNLVHGGDIQEVSLCLAGSNPGANIANVLMHSGLDEDDNIMIVGFEIQHANVEDPKEEPKDAPPAEDPPAPNPDDAPPASGDKTVGDALATLNDDQRAAVNSVIDGIVTEAVAEALAEEPTVQHDNLDPGKGPKMTRNIFDQTKTESKPELKHDDMTAILSVAKGPTGLGGDNAAPSLRQLVRSDNGKQLMHADDYGVQNIEILFPDAQALMRTPTFIDRRQDWVKKFMAGTSHSPFSRVKTAYADITADEARARGYIKAGQKVEEVFPVFKRTTGPAMIYKKQKLDRQDIIDITDFDVVAWMKVEMRGKLDEEIARAALFGDGRPVMVNGELNPDKIPEPTGTSGDGIRSIINDDDLYSTTYSIAMPATPVNEDWNLLLDGVTEAGEFYLGSGNKTAFVPYRVATKLLTIRDGFQKRMYRNLSEVAGDMDVNEIVRVPTELFPEDVLCIVVDLADYNFGTNRGGEITLFDDFDIDFNQYKYLIETYLSGALTLPYAAQVFRKVDMASSTEVVPTEPVAVNNVVTVPTKTGVVYKRTDTDATLVGGSTINLDPDTLPILEIEATPDAGYHFPSNHDDVDTFTFEYQA